MIKPTIGRVVWFIPVLGDKRFEGYGAPFAAHVAYVWGERCVNLMIIRPDGAGVIGETSVVLVQEGDVAPPCGRYAEWMSYQVGQAKKHESDRVEVRGGVTVEGRYLPAIGDATGVAVTVTSSSPS